MEKPFNITEVIDESVGRLCIAIGKGTFRDELTSILLRQIDLAYQRGVESTKK